MSMPTARPGASRLRLVAALATAPLAVPGPAFAGAAPGNNGTLKVHAPGTLFEQRVNEPQQVCAFDLAGFNFDSNQVINYSFTVQGGANNGDAIGTPGSFTVGPDNGRPRGDGRTELLEKADHNLPDGRYKVTGTTNDGSKSKVFSINCPGGGNPEPTPVPPNPDGTVGGVGNPQDEDEGPGGVGGVDTGGGGMGAAPSDLAFLMLVMGLGGAAVTAGALRRRSAG